MATRSRQSRRKGVMVTLLKEENVTCRAASNNSDSDVENHDKEATPLRLAGVAKVPAIFVQLTQVWALLFGRALRT